MALLLQYNLWIMQSCNDSVECFGKDICLTWHLPKEFQWIFLIFKFVAACGYSHIHTMRKPNRINSQNKIMTHFLSSWYIFFHLTSWSSWYHEDGARDLDKILWLSCYNITCGSCKVAMPHLLSFSDSAMSNKLSFPKQN